MLEKKIRVAILDDHQSNIDGYRYRLEHIPSVEIVGSANYGEELEALLNAAPVDVLLLDVSVPTSLENPNPYPILYLIPHFLEAHPRMAILVISMHIERGLIRAVMDAGASGYILKDDTASLKNLGAVVQSLATSGIYLSPEALRLLVKRGSKDAGPLLTARQTEALSLLTAYPHWTTAELAKKLGFSHSTVRNLLSSAYLRLEVSTRAAAIVKARELGLITPLAESPPPI